MANRPTAIFFARVNDAAVLNRNEFYNQDLQILNELGFDVRIATRIRHLRPADLFFVWWWTWAYFPVTYARLLGKPAIVTGTVNWHLMHQRPAWHRWMINNSLRNAAANIFVSETEHQTVTQSVTVNNPICSPHVLDTELYSPRDVPREDVVFTICWMEGKNAVRKCIPEIVEAAALVHQTHPRTRFVIAGEKGSHYPIIAERVRQLQAESYIEFPGVISRDQKIDLLQRCGTYLQPSRFEGFGVAILEAMSCGASIVSSPVGAVPEVLGDTGLLVDGTDPAQIAESVRQLLDDRERQYLAGKRARQRAVELFGFKRRREQMRNLIAGLVPSFAAGSP